MKRCQHKAPFGVACRSISAVGGNDNVDTMYNGSAVVSDIQFKINDDNHGKYIEFGVLIVNENHAIVAWFKRALAMNRNRRNQRQTQKVFYVMPPSDEGGGFLRSKKTEGEKTKDYPSVGCRRQLP